VQEKYLREVLGMDRETPGYVVREECKRKKLRVKAGKRAPKVWRQNGRKGRVQDTEGILESWEKNTEKKEREIYYQWRSVKIKSKRKMDACRAERKEQRHRQAKKKGKN
jgi:hypothetical protein